MKIDGVYKVRKGRYSKDFYFKIKVTSISKQRLGDMTEEDARREGFADYYIDGKIVLTALDLFKARWIDLHGTWDQAQKVYVIGFRVVPE